MPKCEWDSPEKERTVLLSSVLKFFLTSNMSCCLPGFPLRLVKILQVAIKPLHYCSIWAGATNEADDFRWTNRWRGRAIFRPRDQPKLVLTGTHRSCPIWHRHKILRPFTSIFGCNGTQRQKQSRYGKHQVSRQQPNILNSLSHVEWPLPSVTIWV